MTFNLAPGPQAFAADSLRLREQPQLHPILDCALARADVLRERAQILKWWRIGESGGALGGAVDSSASGHGTVGNTRRHLRSPQTYGKPRGRGRGPGFHLAASGLPKP